MPLDRPAVIVMAKSAVPGRVKTRLMPAYTPEQAAGVHQAMLDCVLSRVRAFCPGEHWLAMDGELPEVAGWQTVAQGEGDLGERMERVWQGVGEGAGETGGAVIFLGVDSPDVPADVLGGISSALEACDVAIGPVEDGGYWTLAARKMTPELLHNIDWGGPCVYHQTQAATENAGLSVATLARWHDVDDASDLASLRQRLIGAETSSLRDLRNRLNDLCSS